MNVDTAKARSLFLSAVEHYSPDQWDTYLDDTCRENVALKQRVEVLLRAHQGEDDFLDRGGIENDSMEPTIAEAFGTVIGPYRLVDQIGEGGMGVVFMAEQTHPIQRTVALKIIKPGMDTRQVIACFEAERQALGMLDHPNIARVLDAGVVEAASQTGLDSTDRGMSKGRARFAGPIGRPYFVMELVKGVPLTQHCDERDFSIRQRLEIMVAVCNAVQHAHQKGIIHRDLKPSNVLVAEYDGKPVPKIIDFGVAKATGTHLTDRTLFTNHGQIVGTFEYMSPEQAKFNQLDVDTRSDIYSLGVILYELLVGSTPLEKQRLETVAFDETLRIIREEEPAKPSTRLGSSDTLLLIAANRQTEPARLGKDVRGELDWIVMKCLEKDRNRRYETASALAADLVHYLSDEPVTAVAPTRLYRAGKFVRRNKALVIASSAVMAGLIVGMVGTTIGLVSQSRERKQAQLNLATALQSQDNFVEAEKLYRQVLATAGDTLGDRQRSARILLRLAWIAGDLNEEERLYRQAIDAHRKTFPPGDPSLAHALQTYALALRHAGRPADAEPLLREVYEMRRNATPPDHRSTGGTAVYLGNVLHLQRRYAEAEQLLRAAITEYQLEESPSERHIALARMELGNILTILRRRSEAEAELLAAARSLESQYERVFAENAVAALYMAWDLAEPGKGYDAKFRKWYLQSMEAYGSPLAPSDKPNERE